MARSAGIHNINGTILMLLKLCVYACVRMCACAHENLRMTMTASLRFTK